MPTPPCSRPEDDGDLSPRERAMFEDMTRRLGEETGGPPRQKTGLHSTVGGFAWMLGLLRGVVVAVAVSLASSSRWAAIVVVGTALAVELVLILGRRRHLARTRPDADS